MGTGKKNQCHQAIPDQRAKKKTNLNTSNEKTQSTLNFTTVTWRYFNTQGVQRNHLRKLQNFTATKFHDTTSQAGTTSDVATPTKSPQHRPSSALENTAHPQPANLSDKCATDPPPRSSPTPHVPSVQRTTLCNSPSCTNVAIGLSFSPLGGSDTSAEDTPVSTLNTIAPQRPSVQGPLHLYPRTLQRLPLPPALDLVSVSAITRLATYLLPTVGDVSLRATNRVTRAPTQAPIINHALVKFWMSATQANNDGLYALAMDFFTHLLDIDRHVTVLPWKSSSTDPPISSIDELPVKEYNLRTYFDHLRAPKLEKGEKFKDIWSAVHYSLQTTPHNINIAFSRWTKS